MPLTSQETVEFAAYLDKGRHGAQELDRITSTREGLTLDEAYQIQEQGIINRQKQGEKIIGYKMGLTSKAKREQMNLHSPVYGVLTDKMQVKGAYKLKGRIHPKIEPEIAFLIGKELKGAVTREQVLAACTGVCVALEILDSRYRGFKYFSLPDVVADNSSSSDFILGELVRDFSKLKLAALQMKMSVNGQVAQEAVSSEISGDPVLSVVQLCELLAERGKFLPAGSIVLAGAATLAVALEPGQTISLDVVGLPGVSVQVEASS